MKARLNIEQYFKSLARPGKKKNIIQFVEELPKPKIDVNKDVKQTYYHDRKSKYSF